MDLARLDSDPSKTALFPSGHSLFGSVMTAEMLLEYYQIDYDPCGTEQFLMGRNQFWVNPFKTQSKQPQNCLETGF